MNRLLEEGKLSLIVDLDQTLIHAAVGATIDEWVNAQGELPRVKYYDSFVMTTYCIVLWWDSHLRFLAASFQ